MSVFHWSVLVALGAAFGSSFALNEILLGSCGPLTVSALRVTIGAVGCWIWVLATRRRVRLSEVGIVTVGVFGVFQYAAPFRRGADLSPLAGGRESHPDTPPRRRVGLRRHPRPDPARGRGRRLRAALHPRRPRRTPLFRGRAQPGAEAPRHGPGDPDRLRHDRGGKQSPSFPALSRSTASRRCRAARPTCRWSRLSRRSRRR